MMKVLLIYPLYFFIITIVSDATPFHYYSMIKICLYSDT